MADSARVRTAKSEGTSDEEVVAQVLKGETEMFEVIMRRHNQRLYRVARSILRNDSLAEDVVQEAYVRAYEHLAQFAGRAKFSTWLTRITVNEALAQFRRGGRYEQCESTSEGKGDRMDAFVSPMLTPEQQASKSEMRGLLERSIDALPDSYRAVVMMRDVEAMSTIETAHALDITEESVKTRLHRARRLLRNEFYSHVKAGGKEVFAFQGKRCDRLVKNVLVRIRMPEIQGRNVGPPRIH